MTTENLANDFEYSHEDVVIDPYNCDLNLIIDKECLLAYPQTSDGFCLMWAGAKSTYGVSCGRVAFEVHITDMLESEELAKDDSDAHLIRVGWSLKESQLQLGEDKYSYGYCNQARVCTDCIFKDYGETFDKEDSIGAYIDFETDKEHIYISFSKNGHDLGEAFKVSREELTNQSIFYPHIYTKNIVYEVNFGQRVSFLGDEPFAPIKSGFDLIQKVPLDLRYRNYQAPRDQKDCEILMLIGLPSSGKTHWAKEYMKSHREKCYNLLSMSELFIKARVLGSKKRQQHPQTAKNTSEIYDKIGKCLNKLIETAASLKRNIILDQNNIYSSTRRRKMKLFTGYIRKAICVIPNDDVYKKRLKKSEMDDCKEITMSAIYDMKANFTLPQVGEMFDVVKYVDSNEQEAKKIVDDYNLEGPSCRMQLMLNKRMKTSEEKKQKLGSMRLIRPGYGYGYGREKALSRPSNYGKRSYQSHAITYRQPTPLMNSSRPSGYATAYPATTGWNPLGVPAVPFGFGIPSHWPPQNATFSTQVTIQANSQWTPAMSTNVTHSLSNDFVRHPYNS